MRKFFWIVASVCGLAWAQPARSQPLMIPCYPATSPTSGCVGVKIYAALGYQQITSVSAATGLTVPTGAIIAEICVETQAIRYRDDGTNPTATVGMPIPAATCFQYAGPLGAIKIIEQTPSATIDVSYYK